MSRSKRDNAEVGGARRWSAQLRQLIIDSLPEQLTLPFYLWTRAAAVSLIEPEHRVTVLLKPVSRCLNGSGMSPKKAVRRAYERDDTAIGRRSHKEYPAIAHQSTQEGAMICRVCEMDFHTDHLTVTSFALRGRTPTVRSTRQHRGCSMISTIANQGHLDFMVSHGKLNGRPIIRLMQRLLRQAPGKGYPIVDGGDAKSL